MRELRIKNLFIFLLGLTCLSLGIVLIVKTNLGISVATSVPYVFSLHFTKISFGQWNYIIHGLVLLLLVFVVRKLTIKYLMSFVVAFLFGISIDLFTTLLAPMVVTTFIGKILWFIVGSIVVSIGVAAFIKSNFPILPFDTFIKEVTFVKNIKYSKFKTRFDLVCFTISFAASILFFRGIRGIHVGTLVSAVTLGTLIGICLNFMNKYVKGESILPQERINKILDFDFLNMKSKEPDCLEREIK